MVINLIHTRRLFQLISLYQPQIILNLKTNMYILLYVLGQFFGSLHRDDFRLASDIDQVSGSVILISPSLSPIYNNNPAYRFVYIQKPNLRTVDYRQYFLDLEITAGKMISVIVVVRKNFLFSTYR